MAGEWQLRRTCTGGGETRTEKARVRGNACKCARRDPKRRKTQVPRQLARGPQSHSTDRAASALGNGRSASDETMEGRCPTHQGQEQPAPGEDEGKISECQGGESEANASKRHEGGAPRGQRWRRERRKAPAKGKKSGPRRWGATRETNERATRGCQANGAMRSENKLEETTGTRNTASGARGQRLRTGVQETKLTSQGKSRGENSECTRRASRH